MAVSQSVLSTLLTILIFLTAYLFYLKSNLDNSLTALFEPSISASGITLLDTIPHHLIPTPHNDRRLIVVGDIHGMSSSLDSLLEKLSFNPEKDHLVATGDMISKGPDSRGVVDKLIALNASAVRGNHEHHILKARAKMDRRRKKKKKKQQHRSIFSMFGSDSHAEEDWDNEAIENDDTDDENDTRAQRAKERDRKTARSLKKHHIKWLRSLPIIISLEPILPIYIVHAGLVPGLRVTKQDPWAVMNMRTLRFPKHRALEDQQPLQPDDQQILIPSEDGLEESVDNSEVEAEARRDPVPTDGRSGQRWADVWNKYQRHLPEKKRRAVIYGHDARRGHRVGEYTFGLDSGCVAGGKLTAVVLQGGAQDGEYRHTTVQISC
ncbi:hypothetical protein NLU13_4114 [Sarocladium strictum]|uniref:Calcineurin-like phosphoesterase domain-containing protein n=1 Tax=Sarocladium strictum TaxID=5046 RepID=A0AA39GJ28_SARSR|nr:hypothetical protein NLU13_4114 [Sarocladium strictum]